MSRAILTCGLLLVVGCVSTELTPDADHPANPAAQTAPLPPPPSALQPGFDPATAYGIKAPKGKHDHHRGH